jgi:N-acylneuraminate cytidylyltransferase
LPDVYWQVGNLDVIKIQTIEEQNSLSGKCILPFEVPAEFAIDIDDMTAFEKAAEIIGRTDCVKP